ncbi:hypothetical protein ACA910_015443 [Epithemia clementina (nom. ined.)]
MQKQDAENSASTAISGFKAHADGGDNGTAAADTASSKDGYDKESFESFEDMGLPEDLLRGIYSYGFEKPSAIQQRAILPVMSGRDLIAQAQSGTGKTATFGIGTLAVVDPKRKDCQSIILAPTRELAKQIQTVLAALGDFMGVKVRACVGGRESPVREDCRVLRQGDAHIVVGTPGRVLDLINRGALSLNGIRQVILDEADEMLSLGFREQIYQVFQYLPESVQLCLFSATMPLDILDISKRFLKDPMTVLVKKDELTLLGIKQFYIAVGQEAFKLDTLCDLYESLTISQAIIYCNTKSKVDWLRDELQERDFTVSCIHGELEPEERSLVMQQFRSGSSRVLISTDLLARGIDVHQVSLVINYDIPTNRENYIHRIGRSGRFGRKGVAINLLADRDVQSIRDIEQFYCTEIMELPEDIAEQLK